MLDSPNHTPLPPSSLDNHRPANPILVLGLPIIALLAFALIAKLTITPGLTADDALNGTYQFVWPASRSLTLQDGDFFGNPHEEDSSSPGRVSLWGFAFGNIDGEGGGDAAVILVIHPGGSVAFYELHVLLEQEGEAVHAGRAFLGDRIRLECLQFRGSKLMLRWQARNSYAHAPVTKYFELQDRLLTEVVSP